MRLTAPSPTSILLASQTEEAGISCSTSTSASTDITEFSKSPSLDHRGLFFAAIHVLLLDDNNSELRAGTMGPSWCEAIKHHHHRLLLPFKELQLVSLRLCKEIRTVSAFHVKIARGTPRRLWLGPTSTRQIDRDDRGRRRGRSASVDGSPRVPPMRVTEMTWERTVRELGEGRQVGTRYSSNSSYFLR